MAVSAADHADGEWGGEEEVEEGWSRESAGGGDMTGCARG